jgi:hypothetical protein
LAPGEIFAMPLRIKIITERVWGGWPEGGAHDEKSQPWWQAQSFLAAENGRVHSPAGHSEVIREKGTNGINQQSDAVSAANGSQSFEI